MPMKREGFFMRDSITKCQIYSINVQLFQLPQKSLLALDVTSRPSDKVETRKTPASLF
jgi:hypothetical protein